MAQRPTVKDVADEAGVSLATVSLVLNGKAGVGPDTRQRVQIAIDRLGYQRRGQRLVIGLLIERLSVPAYSDPLVGLMIHGVEVEAGRHGYHVLLASIEPASHAGAGDGRWSSRSAGWWWSAAAISRMPTSACSRTAGLPLVLVDNYVNGLTVPCVLGDNVTGAYLATRHLIELGHERIALLEGPRKYKT